MAVIEVRSYRSPNGGGSAVILQRNKGHWFVVQWGTFSGKWKHTITRYRQEKHRAIEAYETIERELVTRDMLRALGIRR